MFITCNEVHKRTVQRIVKKLQKRIAKKPIPVLSLLIILLRTPFGSNLNLCEITWWRKRSMF